MASCDNGRAVANRGREMPTEVSPTLVALAAGIGVGVGGMTAAHNEGEKVTPIAERNIAEKLGGKESKVTVVEVTLEAGQAGAPHRHPGPVFGYVLEGE